MNKILSVISLISGIGVLIGAYFFLSFPNWQEFFYVYVFLSVSILGLISGIVSFAFNSTKKKISAIGIVLSLISLFIWSIFWFFLFGFSHMQ